MILNESCQNAYSITMFHNIFLEIYNSSFPVKRKSLKPHYKTRKPWLTNGMKCSIKHKKKLYAHYKKYPSQSNKKLYKEYGICQLDYYDGPNVHTMTDCL